MMACSRPNLQRATGLVLLSLLHASGTLSHSAESMLQCGGNLEFVQRSLREAPVVEKLFFRAELGDCRWRIRTAQSSADLTNTSGAYCSYAYDGASLYRLSSLGPGPSGGKPSTNDPVQKTAIISLGDFPQFDPSRVSLVWIALASRCYLENQKLIRCKPVWAASQASFSDDRGFLRTEIVQLEQGWLPKQIGFFTDGSAFIDIPNPPKYEVKYPPPFDQGFKKAHYDVITVKDFHGKPYPGEFSLTVYNPASDAKSTNDLNVVWEVRGRVVEVRLLKDVRDIRPEMSGLMQVIDYRSATNGLQPFQYLADKWRDHSDKQYLSSLERHLEIQKQKKHHSTMGKAIVRGVLLLTTIAAAVIVLRSRKSTNPQDKT